ncbi:MAG: hypothetical protein IJL03_03575 [Lachnospiraceae bacterium]|nr:hypothetical protein [Lachnospiraceae bacterium]
MGRFLKELKYSIVMKKHIFFIVLVGFVACGAAWLFQDTLREDLKKSFPSTYDLKNASTEEQKYLLSGKVSTKSPQVTDSDLKAEIAFHSNLVKAGWVKGYEEICKEYLQIASFLGPDQAVKGFETDEFYSNKDIDNNGAKYTTVQTIWMDEKMVETFRLGEDAKQIFSMPNDYLEKIYVMLGSDYQMENGYRIGNILTAKNSVGKIQLQIAGFLPKGATAKIGDKEIDLSSYILCPFISMDDIYEIKEEVPVSYTDGVYIQVKYLNDEFLAGAYLNNPPNKKNDQKTGLQYAEVRSLWIERSAVTEDAPDWLKALANSTSKDVVRVMVGANYGAAGTIAAGTKFDMYAAQTTTNLEAHNILDPGTTWKIYGRDVVLDDYIVFLQPEKQEEETANKTENNSEEPGSSEPILTDEPVGPLERTFKVDERSMLFHVQFMMNSGYIKTTQTRNEAQLSLAEVIEESWRDFHRDNPKKDPLTTYRIDGASKDNSILFRENSMKLTDQVLKFTKKAFPICMILFALYLFYKFYCGKEFYTSLYLTGTNRVEMMALYLIEGLLMIVLAAALSYGCAFVICKLLKLHMTAPKPVFRRIGKLVGYPTAAIMIWILIRDFARMFRRTQEV